MADTILTPRDLIDFGLFQTGDVITLTPRWLVAGARNFVDTLRHPVDCDHTFTPCVACLPDWLDDYAITTLPTTYGTHQTVLACAV